MKGQSAIEYLMTYGWMLLVVAIAGGAIFSLTNVSTESVSGFQGEDVIIENIGQSSYGGLDMELLRANPGVDRVTEVRVEGYDVPNFLDFPVGNSDLASHPFVAETSGTNSLDVEIVYNTDTLNDISSTGTVTGSYELDVPENLNAFYPLREKYYDGNAVYDISQNRINGQASNFEKVEQGRGDTEFSGNPVVVPHDSGLGLNSQFSVSMFAKDISLDTDIPSSNLNEVSSCSELQSIDPSGDHYLSSDIDCSGQSFTPIGWGTGDSSFDGQEFTGSLYGRGHTIEGLDIAPSGDDYYGSMIPVIATEGMVKNFNLVDSQSTGTNPSGLLTAQNRGTISDITINNSQHYGANFQAAIVAGDNYGIIRNVGVNSGRVDAGNNFVGGITGNMPQGRIENSYFIGEVFQSGEDRGGIVGQMTGGEIINTYSAANVSGSSNTGALVGELGGDIKDSYWDSEATSNSEALGNQDDSNYEVESRTTSEMKSEENLGFFDFEINWKFESGVNEGYPVPRTSEMNLVSKGSDLEVNGVPGDQAWNNFVITFNQTEASFYVDGVLQGRESLGSEVSQNNQDFLIGDNTRGVLSDVMVFDNQLSQRDVRSHYERWSQ